MLTILPIPLECYEYAKFAYDDVYIPSLINDSDEDEEEDYDNIKVKPAKVICNSVCGHDAVPLIVSCLFI